MMADVKRSYRLGLLHLILGTSALVAALFAYLPMVSVMGSMAVLLLTIAAVPQLVAGIALLLRVSWALPAGLIAGAVSLVSIPLGTVLGLYTFSVLTSADDGGEEDLSELP